MAASNNAIISVAKKLVRCINNKMKKLNTKEKNHTILELFRSLKPKPIGINARKVSHTHKIEKLKKLGNPA